jgi:molybdate/tungstate transport system substrate-binding protein
MQSRKYMLPVLIIVLMLCSLASGCISSDDEEEQEPVTLKVLHAGSLTGPFEEIEAAFEAEYGYIDVQLEPAGSSACIRKITDTGVEADILASADYTLIPSMMMPDYADWYIAFANNEMVLTYSENSAYADEITQDKWYEILRREDVIWAFSNPNLDPCGYRTPMVIQLAEDYYDDDMIFDDLIGGQTAIYGNWGNGVFAMHSPEDLAPNTAHVTIRDKSVELVSMVLEGGLDYAWEYISVAEQNGLDYVRMPDAINLSAVAFADNYATVSITTSDGNTNVGKAIVYGVTIPTNAPNPEEAALFIEYIINEFGQSVFTSQGQPPLVPALASDVSLVPEELQDLVSEM